MIRNFWWAGVQEDDHTSPISFRAWEDICQPKSRGGLGIKSLQLANNKDQYLTTILIAKDYQNLLNKIWKDKLIPPTNKTFMWRLIRQAVATGERASCFSTRITKNCTYCGQLENDMHLFFTCAFPRAVWFTGSRPLRTDALPQERWNIKNSGCLSICCPLSIVLWKQVVMLMVESDVSFGLGKLNLPLDEVRSRVSKSLDVGMLSYLQIGSYNQPFGL